MLKAVRFPGQPGLQTARGAVRSHRASCYGTWLLLFIYFTCVASRVCVPQSSKNKSSEPFLLLVGSQPHQLLSAPGQMCALDVGSGFGNAGAVWATTTTPVWHFQEETRSPRVLSEPGKPGFGQVVLQHVCCKRSGWRGAGAAGTERGVQCLGKEHFWSFPSSCGRTHPHKAPS